VPDQEPSLAGFLQTLGEALHELHGFACPQALGSLWRLPKREHSSAFVQDLIARCHFEMAEYARAAEAYARNCEAHRLHRLLGLEYHSTALWHLQEAAQLGHLAQQVLEWDRLRPQVWCVVGNCLSLQREHDQAIRFFRRAVQLDPCFTYAHTLIAHEYAAMEKFDKAIQMYQRALSLDSRHYNAWWGLGNVYYRQEEYPNARYHFQRAVAINGCNAVLRTSLGMALQSLGEPERALRLFSVAARDHHCAALASFQKGCALAALGRHEEAIDELRRAQGLAPRESCVHFQLGRAHVKSGDSQRALLHFTMAMDLSGAKDSKDHQVVAMAQLELQRAADARREPELASPAALAGGGGSAGPRARLFQRA